MTADSEVYLHEIAADPAARARETVRAGHQQLLAALRPKVALLTELRLDWIAREAAWDTLTAFCTSPVRAHLRSAEQAFYTLATSSPETRLLAVALRATAAQLRDQIDALERASEADAAARLAPVIEALLISQLAVERRVLLPVLATLPGADLPALVAQYTALLETGSRTRGNLVAAA